MTLTRTDLLDVVFSVPENLFTALDMRNAQYRPVVKINAMPDRQFTADYKEHTGSSDSSTLTWQIILTMPRPADFPAVGGVSGTVTINLANLPASAGQNAVVVPVEAVFNPDNRPRNEPHVWVVQEAATSSSWKRKSRRGPGDLSGRGDYRRAQRRRARSGGGRQRIACATAGSYLDA